MLKVEAFGNSNGFGNGELLTLGEYTHSQNMRKSPNGLMPGWLISVVAYNTGVTSNLDLINWFAQAMPGASNYVYGLDVNGRIFQSLDGTGAWGFVYQPDPTNHASQGNGLIGTQTNKLLYAGERYLGRYDGSANYNTGTVTTTLGSPNIVGSGTTFTSGMVGKRITINGGTFYTISAFTDATHITLSSNFIDGSFAGVSFEIYMGWTDQYKDFGSGSITSGDYRPSDTYEDWVVWGNGNKLAIYNVTDESFNAAGFTLPAGFKVRDVSAGATGLLSGCTFGNRSMVFLWDLYSDRSIAPWIWIAGSIQSIVPYSGQWLVITNRKIYLTNGYTIEEFAKVPDATLTTAYLQVAPQGAEVIGDRLVILNTIGTVTRLRPGAWILNLTTKLWEFATPANGIIADVTMRAIFFDSNFTTHISYGTTLPSRKNIGTFAANIPDKASFISEPKGLNNNIKVAEAVKLNLGLSPITRYGYKTSFTVAVKVASSKRQLWTYGQVKTLQTVANKIVVDGSQAGYNNAQVGDEIYFCEGVNAGITAHITAITGQDTATETWTLDTTLGSMTEANVILAIQPFKLIKKLTFTNIRELTDYYLDVKNKYKSKKFYVKVLIEGLANLEPEFRGGDIVYNDLGVI